MSRHVALELHLQIPKALAKPAILAPVGQKNIVFSPAKVSPKQLLTVRAIRRRKTSAEVTSGAPGYQFFWPTLPRAAIHVPLRIGREPVRQLLKPYYIFSLQDLGNHPTKARHTKAPSSSEAHEAEALEPRRLHRRARTALAPKSQLQDAPNRSPETPLQTLKV